MFFFQYFSLAFFGPVSWVPFFREGNATRKSLGKESLYLGDNESNLDINEVLSDYVEKAPALD